MPKARPTHFAADPLATSADATEVHVVAFNPCPAAVATTRSCYDRQGMRIVSTSPMCPSMTGLWPKTTPWISTSMCVQGRSARAPLHAPAAKLTTTMHLRIKT